MRYKLFNDRDDSAPVISAPWRWLAYRFTYLFSMKWDWCRLADSKTGDTLIEWERGSRCPQGPAIYPRRDNTMFRAVVAACAAIIVKTRQNRGRS